MDIQAVIFDLDGVLVDSREAWHHIHRTIFGGYGFEIPDREKWNKTLWGRDIRDVCKDFKISEQDEEKIIKWKDRLLLENLDKIVIFDGVELVLNGLKSRGIRLGVVSNNNKDFIEKVLKKLDIYKFFDYVIGDEFGPKPGPAGILKILEILNCEKSKSVFVGDTQVDVDAGKAADIRTLIVGRDVKEVKDLKIL